VAGSLTITHPAPADGVSGGWWRPARAYSHATDGCPIRPHERHQMRPALQIARPTPGPCPFG